MGSYHSKLKPRLALQTCGKYLFSESRIGDGFREAVAPCERWTLIACGIFVWGKKQSL